MIQFFVSSFTFERAIFVRSQKKTGHLNNSLPETPWEESQKLKEMFKGSPKTTGFRQWRQNLERLFCKFFVSSKLRFYSLGGLQV